MLVYDPVLYCFPLSALVLPLVTLCSQVGSLLSASRHFASVVFIFTRRIGKGKVCMHTCTVTHFISSVGFVLTLRCAPALCLRPTRIGVSELPLACCCFRRRQWSR
ncbi:hypothetical protein TRVL_05603 [Trypanosoma vivax]|nr:hypothetical protein TRVL_05603 [Trypanosoma vivax]